VSIAIKKWLSDNQSDLRGVYHTAGILHDALITDLDDDALKSVLAPKVLGAWNIHEATKNLNLQECLFYSSVAARK